MKKPFFYLAFGFIFSGICTYLELEIGLDKHISSCLVISEIIIWFWAFHEINN